jgi:hypothetical protein
MTMLWQWFTANTTMILAVMLAFYIIAFNKLPEITAWQAFLDSFESKGGQLLLLWVSDGLVLLLLIHFWKFFDAQLQTTIVGILSAVNGAFLGAIGARNTTNGGAVGDGKPAAPAPPPPASPIPPSAAHP